jgi:hypothetical protein
MPKLQHGIRVQSTRSWLRKFNYQQNGMVIAIVLSLGISGCSTVGGLKSIASSGTINDTVETLRNKSYSARAYYRRQHNFANVAYPRDFQAGFRAGFEAIADGKPGCPPTFPPKQYWGWEFQSVEGQSRTAAWFAGYPYGVQAARDEGVTGWNHLRSGAECGNGCSTGTCGTTGCSTCNQSNANIPMELHTSTPGHSGYPREFTQPQFPLGGDASYVDSSIGSTGNLTDLPVGERIYDGQQSATPAENTPYPTNHRIAN